MDFNYLSDHQDELLEFLRANDYAETYVQRYRTTIKQITTNADGQNLASYEDVYQWYVDSGSVSACKGLSLVGRWHEYRADFVSARTCTTADNHGLPGHHDGTGGKSNGYP